MSNKNTIYQNVWDADKAVLRVKCSCKYLEKIKRLKTNYLSFFFKELGKVKKILGPKY